MSLAQVSLVNTLVFFALMFIWTNKDWMNLCIKVFFLLLGILNLGVLMGVKL